MTVTVSPDKIYFAMCLGLLILQLIHYVQLRKAKKEVQDLWIQLGLLITTLSTKLTELETKIKDVENKSKN